MPRARDNAPPIHLTTIESPKWSMVVEYCPKDPRDELNRPLYGREQVFKRSYLAQGLQYEYFPLGMVLSDYDKTLWMVYQTENGRRLIEAEWDEEAETFLLVEGGRRYKPSSSGTGLTKVKK